MADEADDHEDEDGDGEVAEPCEEGRREAEGDVSEETAGEEVGLGPEDGAGDVVENEAAVRHAGLAGDGRGNGGEAGDELGEEESDRAATLEVALCLGDAGAGVEGETAEEAEDAVSVAAAEEEPHAVGDEAGDQDGDEGVDIADAMGGAEGSGGEQDGDAGDGDSQLLQQDPEEEDAIRVLDEENRGRHGNLDATR